MKVCSPFSQSAKVHLTSVAILVEPFVPCPTCAMPIRWDTPRQPEKYTIVCQGAQSLDKIMKKDWPRLRYLTIFISGEFTLEEANAFAIEAFDNSAVPSTRDFFGGLTISVASMAFSADSVPLALSHLIDNYSTVDNVDEYTFHLMKHIADTFFRMADEDAKRLKEKEEKPHGRKRRR